MIKVKQRDPTPYDDISRGNLNGTFWITSSLVYILDDETLGNASWRYIDNAVNYIGIINPTTSDDSLLGYSVGSVWENEITNKKYLLTNETIGSALWEEIAKPTQTTYIQQTRPTGEAPWIWFEIDENNNPIDMIINNGE